MKSWTFNTN